MENEKEPRRRKSGEETPEPPPPRKPHRFSRPGWKHALKTTLKSVSEDRLTLVAAGVAFYLMFAIVPGIAGIISIYGFVADPDEVQEHFEDVEEVVPEEAAGLLREQMDRIAEDQTTAGIGALIGILLAVWASSRATKAMMMALNIVYDERESRNFVKLAAVGFALTLAVILLGLLAIAAIVFLPALLAALPVPEGVGFLLAAARWVLLLLIGVFALALIYRFGPSHKQPAWKWLTWGSGVATVLWLLVSALFSVYVANFASYNETYGALGAVIILLMWLYLTAFVALLGAELDAAFEQQTKNEAA